MNCGRVLATEWSFIWKTITGIDKTYYEAAGIDGAGPIQQQIRWHHLPLMKTVITAMFIMAVGRISTPNFGLFYQVPRDSNTLYNYVYTLDVVVFSNSRKLQLSVWRPLRPLYSLLPDVLRFWTANAIIVRLTVRARNDLSRRRTMETTKN